MYEQLRQQVETVINAYNREFLFWNAMPAWAKESRRRLDLFVEHDIECVIENEVKILWRKIERMRRERSCVTLH